MTLCVLKFGSSVLRSERDLPAAVREIAARPLYKDTDGLYTADPNRDPAARRLAVASWATVARLGGVVQEKAVRFAAAQGIQFAIPKPGSPNGTRVGCGPDRLDGTSAVWGAAVAQEVPA